MIINSSSVRQFSILIGLLVLIFSCASIKETYIDPKTFKVKSKINLHKKSDDLHREQLRDCSKQWIYKKYPNDSLLKVIQYHKGFRFDLINQPALIIGETPTGDTIRLLSYGFHDDIEINQTIRIFPDSLINLTDDLSLCLVKRDLPIFLSKKKGEDRYFCDIKQTYFVTIKE